MRSIICIIQVLLLFLLFHACTLESEAIRPTCRIFENDVTEKWWVLPEKEHPFARLYFHSYGELENRSEHETFLYTLEDCNRICVDFSPSNSEEWTIEEVTSRRLMISIPGRGSVVYRPS